MVFAIVIAVLAALMSFVAYFSASETSKGIKAGVAVESNWLIAALFGNKPSFAQVYAYDLGEVLLGVAAAVCGSVLHFPAASILAVAWLATMTLKHYQAYRQWAWLIKNPGKTIAEMETTAWQKIVGFWG